VKEGVNRNAVMANCLRGRENGSEQDHNSNQKYLKFSVGAR